MAENVLFLKFSLINMQWLISVNLCYFATALNYEALLHEATEKCVGENSVMAGSSCYTLHTEMKNFSDAFEDCQSRGERLAHFYTRNQWIKVRDHFIQMQTIHSPLIGLKQLSEEDPAVSENYGWLTTSVEDFMETSYADQEEIGNEPARFNNPCGKVLFVEDYIGTARCWQTKPYLCEKVIPMQQYFLRAQNKKSMNSISTNMTNLKFNQSWFCGLFCLGKNGCVGFNYWVHDGGGCQFLVKLSDLNELVEAPGFSYYERYEKM